MFCRRKVTDHFQPLFDKENTNSLNFESLQVERTGTNKRFTLKLSESKRRNQSANRDAEICSFSQKQEHDSQSFWYRTAKKPSDVHEHPTQCPKLQTPKKRQREGSNFDIDISSKKLNFSSIQSDKKNEQNEKWKFEVIEVSKPDNFLDSDTEEQEALERWDREYQSYDMDSDKQNMPDSDAEESPSEEQSDAEYEMSEREVLRPGRNVVLFSERFSASKLEKKTIGCLDEITEVDQVTKGSGVGRVVDKRAGEGWEVQR